MALTKEQLAAALRVGNSAEELTQMERLLAVTAEMVTAFAPDAPETIEDEARIRLAGYFYDQPTSPGSARFANALRNSGAAALLLPYRAHRAGVIGVIAKAESSGLTPALDVFVWALSGNEDLIPLAKIPDIPASKVTGLDAEEMGAITANVANWAVRSNTDEIPLDKIPQLTAAKIPDLPASKLPDIPVAKIPDLPISKIIGLATALAGATNAATWARTGNTDAIPITKLPDIPVTKLDADGQKRVLPNVVTNEPDTTPIVLLWRNSRKEWRVRTGKWQAGLWLTDNSVRAAQLHSDVTDLLLPASTTSDNDKVLTVAAGSPVWKAPAAAAASELPDISGSADNGKVLTVANEEPEWRAVPTELPASTTSDNDKVLTVAAGSPVWKAPASGGGSVTLPEWRFVLHIELNGENIFGKFTGNVRRELQLSTQVKGDNPSLGNLLTEGIYRIESAPHNPNLNTIEKIRTAIRDGTHNQVQDLSFQTIGYQFPNRFANVTIDEFHLPIVQGNTVTSAAEVYFELFDVAFLLQFDRTALKLHIHGGAWPGTKVLRGLRASSGRGSSRTYDSFQIRVFFRHRPIPAS